MVTIMITASEYYSEIMQQPPLSSGDPSLDQILKGGFIKGPVHFIYGSPQLLSLVLMKTAVNALSPPVQGGLGARTVAYVDGMNHFNPYTVSQLAVSCHLDPIAVLKQIIVSRTFTFNQMVEVLEEKVGLLENTDVILVDGMTAMFEEIAHGATDSGLAPNRHSAHSQFKHKMPSDGKDQKLTFNPKAYQSLNRMFSGLKLLIEQTSPHIILTGSLNSRSTSRIAGGHLLSHFCGVIAGICDQPRHFEYYLDQHPFLMPRCEKVWKPLLLRQSPQLRRSKSHDPNNLTLDAFVMASHSAHK
jgi:hypothetical protein